MSKYSVIFVILFFCQLAAAQFGFFEQMFQGENPGRQQRQRPPGADHWRAQADAGESVEYLDGKHDSRVAYKQSLAPRIFALIPLYAWKVPHSALVRMQRTSSV